MNSLNIITSRVTPSSTPTPSRSNSLSHIGLGISQDEDEKTTEPPEDPSNQGTMESYPNTSTETHHDEKRSYAEETTPLLPESKESGRRSRWWHSLPRDIASSIIGSIRWVFATLASPGVYLIACFCDADGNFAPWSQTKRAFGGRKAIKSKKPLRRSDSQDGNLDPCDALRHTQSSSSSTAVSSESESDDIKPKSRRHTRSRTLQSSEEINPAKKSIRIKLNNDEALEQRRHRKTQSAVMRTKAGELGGEELAAHIKSPTSPIAALTKYPRAPAPPRPLIPRRQPSYLNVEPPRKPTKTLILDLDETLIHSMSKGGRMSTGHMVEVRLSPASLGMNANGPQHPILYWVNKRPYCDEFLRRVVKWFNLVIFTAAVQEYADPVIDWLESEKKFFSARYYRQHCTHRQGAFIKDLSQVEPDLSTVMILDNSPQSYVFHEGKRSCRIIATSTDLARQCDTDTRLDQRPDRLRSDASDTTAGGSAICPRREVIASVARRPGGSELAMKRDRRFNHIGRGRGLEPHVHIDLGVCVRLWQEVIGIGMLAVMEIHAFSDTQHLVPDLKPVDSRCDDVEPGTGQ